MIRIGFLVGALLLASACASPKVGPASPRPNVAIAADRAPSALELDASILDDFSTSGSGSVMAVPVTGWRQTLTNGFDNAFRPGGTSGAKLQLVVAELSFAPAAIAANHQVKAIRAQIRYKARLLDGSGAELGVLAGMAEAREANSSSREEAMTDNTAKAVEAMYEQLAGELLAAQPHGD